MKIIVFVEIEVELLAENQSSSSASCHIVSPELNNARVIEMHVKHHLLAFAQQLESQNGTQLQSQFSSN
jgi:hypothetical protein